MAVKYVESPVSATPRVTLPGSSYLLYGLRVRSEVRLPLTPVPAGPEAPHIEIRMFPAAACPQPDGPEVGNLPCTVHGADMRVNRGPGGAWIWCNDIGTFHVSADLKRIDSYLYPDRDPDAPGLALTGPVMVFVLHMLRRPTLHASAVAIAHKGVAFLGGSGSGKSTIAAGFMRMGIPLFTDDALPLKLVEGTVWAEPGVPFMKIWPETAESVLGLDGELPSLMALTRKKLLGLENTVSLATAPLPLAAVYLVNRYDPTIEGTTAVTTAKLSQRDGIAILLTHTALRYSMLPHEEARLLPMYAAILARTPVRVLGFPSGFDLHAAACERVITDMGAGE